MLSAGETMLPAESSAEATAGDMKTSDSALSALLRGDLVPLLMWSMLVLLLMESWLYHRHAV